MSRHRHRRLLRAKLRREGDPLRNIRPPLTPEQIEENARIYREAVSINMAAEIRKAYELPLTSPGDKP